MQLCMHLNLKRWKSNVNFDNPQIIAQIPLLLDQRAQDFVCLLFFADRRPRFVIHTHFAHMDFHTQSTVRTVADRNPIVISIKQFYSLTEIFEAIAFLFLTDRLQKAALKPGKRFIIHASAIILNDKTDAIAILGNSTDMNILVFLVLLEPVNSALPSPNLDLLRQLSIKEIPLVWLRSALPEPQHAPVVTEDNEGGARMLVRYLLNKGHRDIAGIFRHDDRSGHERYLGFLSELMSSALPAEDRVLWYGRNELEAVLDGDMEPLLRFIRGRLRPCSAAVCHIDRIAEPLIRCLLQAGLRVPEDIAVVSFDNSPLCRLAPVPITSLSHARQHLGDAAVRTMTGLLRGRLPHKEVLGWTLHERQSG